MTFGEFEAMGYQEPRLLPTGETAAVQRFMFTVGVVTGLDDFGYRCRWCYTSYLAASQALAHWSGKGNPPGVWIKQKGRTETGEVVDRGYVADGGKEA